MTGIEYVDDVLNPFPGCRKCSPGCKNCYAERFAKRLKATGHPAYQSVVDKNGWTGAVYFNEKELLKPLKRKKPTRYLVQSMGDLYYKEVLIGFLTRLFDVMKRCPQHTFMLLTKRAENLDIMRRKHDHWRYFGEGDYLENVLPGISAEDQKHFDDRWPYLKQTPAAIVFISYEPALGPLILPDDFLRRGEKAGVICGGESGPGARPMQPEWPRGVRDQCARAGVPFFFKQWGKKKAGRLLDGRTWDQLPEV